MKFDKHEAVLSVHVIIIGVIDPASPVPDRDVLKIFL